MTDTDKFIVEKFVPFREKIIEALEEKHPHILSLLETVISGRKNRVGLQVMEHGKKAGEYTLHLNGVHIEKTDVGTLAAEVKHPLFGEIKPYLVLERDALEKAVQDKEFIDDTFSALSKLLPEVTIKFIR